MTQSAAHAPISLLTFVLQAHHCTILEDWITFFDHPIAGLVVHVGAGPEIRTELETLAQRYNMSLCILGEVTPRETTNNERDLLAAQLAEVHEGYGCVVRLDTIPYRTPGLLWEDAAFAQMEAHGARFITGSTQPFSRDRTTADVAYGLTQRISNCFLIITPDAWLGLQTGTERSEGRHGRFLVEGAPEDYLKKNDVWGLRLINRPDWRVFHCQEWGPRLLEVRSAFRAGRKIAPFMRGYQDKLPQRFYYMYPQPSTLRRLRVLMGRWRRKLLGRPA